MIEMPADQTCQAKDNRFPPIIQGDDGVWRPGPVKHGCDHKATIMWSEGTVAMVHGMYSWWCDCCALEVWVTNARKAAANLVSLEERLAAACQIALPDSQ